MVKDKEDSDLHEFGQHILSSYGEEERVLMMELHNRHKTVDST
jgi:hypothetical protein